MRPGAAPSADARWVSAGSVATRLSLGPAVAAAGHDLNGAGPRLLPRPARFTGPALSPEPPPRPPARVARFLEFWTQRPRPPTRKLRPRGARPDPPVGASPSRLAGRCLPPGSSSNFQGSPCSLGAAVSQARARSGDPESIANLEGRAFHRRDGRSSQKHTT